MLFIYLFFIYIVSISTTDSITPNIYWREYAVGDIPCDAYEGAPGIYIGQVNAASHNLPATIYPTGEAVVVLAGKTTTKLDIKILCTPDKDNLYWEYVDFEQPQTTQLQDAVKGGFQNEAHDILYIGKAFLEEEWRIGKVHTYDFGNNRGLWIWNSDGQYFKTHKFYILKYKIVNLCKAIHVLKMI